MFIYSLGLLLPGVALGDSVVGSKHDLSDPLGTNEVCVFCHTPHHANTAIAAPLWNRFIGNVTFSVYNSPTMDTVPSNPPIGVSLACLSCHDGVLSNGDKHDLVKAPGSPPWQDTTSWPNCARCHPTFNGEPDNSQIWLGTDLRNDHPISMSYPTTSQDPYFHVPPDSQKGWSDVKLYNGKVECASCHNVHDKAITPFLRKTNTNSALCFTCHDK